MRRRLALVSTLLVVSVSAQTAPPAVVLSAEGKVHADVRAFPGGPTGEAPGVLLRRARIEVTAEVDGRYRLVPLWYHTVINHLTRKNLLHE